MGHQGNKQINVFI